MITGTIPTQTVSNATVGQLAGYYDAFDLSAMDTELAYSNIRSTVSIYGVAGKPNVVNTRSGNATAADIAAGKKAWVGGSELTGTAERFTDNGNGTVTDNLHGLTWLKNGNCWPGKLTWAAANLAANTLNNGECGLTDGSPEGWWRLLTIWELYTFVDPG